MNEIRSVKLELVRPGPAHNQLLSPLTPYLALCGAEGPVTINMPFEQRQLFNRLQRLRYTTDTGEIPMQQRQAEVREIGEALGRVLAMVPALFSELGDARSEDGSLVHLRLSLSPLELGMVPFEFAIGPDGFPGSGSPLFLQSRTPITVTREVRRGRPLRFTWNRPPRVLFAFATPHGFAPVPAQDHLRALRKAIDPWVQWVPDPEGRVENVKKILTVLPDATFEAVRKKCAEHEFTHIHILAHGAPLDPHDDRHYGLALCGESAESKADIVDGERLAMALMALDSDADAKRRPTVVTLATCDSGAVGDIVTPGGSIAHELHAAGIPWVIASQLPLWMRASSVAAEVVYTGLLRGDDPRWVLYGLRQRLRTDCPETHDWASIVAYATVPWRFEEEIEAFRDAQTQSKIDLKFDRADGIVKDYKANGVTVADADQQERRCQLHALCESIRSDFALWRRQLTDSAAATSKSRQLGVSGASEKRIAILYQLAKEPELSKQAYVKARDFYKSALELDRFNHWVMTQYLSLLASLATPKELPGLAGQYGELWNMARQIASWEVQKQSGTQQAWALATLVELTLLGAMYGGEKFDREKAKRDMGAYLAQLRQVVLTDPFPIFSTERQFKRYVDFWPRPEWNDLAEAALQVLGDN